MGTIHRFTGSEDLFDWEQVVNVVYDSGGVVGATKKVIIGSEDGSDNFRIRYFRLEPGGNSRLEQHAHEHGVLMLHGRVRVRHGDEYTELGPLDAIFIPGDELHQLETVGEEAAGFICVVPAH
jgi:quercetin dioxygenase-like cupin family protein